MFSRKKKKVVPPLSVPPLSIPPLSIPPLSVGIKPQRNDPRLVNFINSAENCSPLRASVVGTHYPYIKEFCDLIPLKNVKKIYGPVSYSEHISKDGKKRICIFGEEHTLQFPPALNKSDTTTVPSLFRAMIETHPDRFYDFFLELEYIKTDEKVRSVGIQVFDHILKDCLRVLKDCPYPNLRAHYTDYRMMLGPDLKEILVRLNQLMDLRDSGFKIVADPYYDKENLEQMMADLISRIRQFVESDPKLIKTTSNIAENNLVIFNYGFACCRIYKTRC